MTPRKVDPTALEKLYLVVDILIARGSSDTTPHERSARKSEIPTPLFVLTPYGSFRTTVQYGSAEQINLLRLAIFQGATFIRLRFFKSDGYLKDVACIAVISLLAALVFLARNSAVPMQLWDESRNANNAFEMNVTRFSLVTHFHGSSEAMIDHHGGDFDHYSPEADFFAGVEERPGMRVQVAVPGRDLPPPGNMDRNM